MEDPIELSYYLQNPKSELALKECKRVADIFSRFGALTARDPRITFEDNNIFLNVLENYFAQPDEVKLKDSRPEWSYQVGVTPEGREIPKIIFDTKYKDKIAAMREEDRPHMPSSFDVKWRYFHRLGTRPSETRFPLLANEDVIPAAFPDWKEKLDNWGLKLLKTGETLSEMCAVGFGLPKDIFSELMKDAPHLLAPTASDLNKYGTLNQILAGYHQDLNFMTLHGKSRYPGLFIWLRNGKKLPVSIPDGCILAQAGMQFEYLMAGRVMAGFHEVVVTEQTLAALEAARIQGRSCWRISSTVFAHIASDQQLKPLFPLMPEEGELFPPILAGDQVARELEAIKLKGGEY